MRHVVLFLAVLLTVVPASAQECERKRDEFQQEDYITCGSDYVDVEYLGSDPDEMMTIAWGRWVKGQLKPYVITLRVYVEGISGLDMLRADKAQLIVDNWRGTTPVTSEHDESYYLHLQMDQQLATRIAGAETFKARVGGWPFDVSSVTWQIAQVLEMTTGASFGEKAKPSKEPGGKSGDPETGTQQEAAAPYEIEGLDRDPQRAPLPRYTEKVNARIRVQITVNPEGHIVRRIPLRKGNPQLEAAVMDALQQWRFNALPPAAPQENQTGTITFTFRLDGATQETEQSTKQTENRDWECESANETETYTVVENSPELLGGTEALQDSLDYPDFAKKAGIEGRVIVRFIVDEQGNVTNPEIARGETKHLNKAAIEAVKKQNFKPGMQRGKCVKVQMSLPVTFRLQ